MPENSWPTEDAATKAVDAAARKAHEESRREVAEATRIPIERYSTWDEAGPIVQNQWRQRVLPIVWAALTALTDPRYPAWNEGYAYAWWAQTGTKGAEPGPTANPYPAPSAPDFI